jgi:16S rRNA (guanine966-N2)-methyltransferase
MRIIAGQWRGRNLVAPDGQGTRPTADRTRETLFSMLVSRIGDFEGLAVADLFAGSGALGLEESDAAAIRALRQNIANLRAQAQSDVRAGSVMALGPAAAPLDLVLLDPPYGTGAGVVALEKLNRLGWIGEASWISLETAAHEEPKIKGLDAVAERRVGKARLTLLRLRP